MRVPAEVVLSGDPETRSKAIYREWAQRQSSAAGATRFDALLGLVGLDGDVPAAVRRHLFELGQVRNVMLHRGGLVDREFAAACPWLGAEVGAPLKIGHHRFEEYAFGAMHYVAEIRQRMGAQGDSGRRVATDSAPDREQNGAGDGEGPVKA
jgi:hypothetical protein